MLQQAMVARRVTVTAARHDRHALLLARGSLTRGEVKLKLMWDLTFDMSGGAKRAQRALGRPLDGGVRAHSRSWLQPLLVP